MEKEFKYEKELNAIKNYISLGGNHPRYVVSVKTGVDIEIIKELVELGYLQEKDGVLSVANKISGFNKQKRAQLISELKFDCIQHPGQDNKKSKLVEDLRSKKDIEGRNTGR